MKDFTKPEEKLEICQLRVQQLETCHRINSLLISEFNLGNLLDTIMETAKEVMNADASSLLQIDQEHGDLIFQVALGGVGTQLKTLARLKIGEGIAGTVAETGKALIIPDAYEHPKFNPEYDKKTGFKTGAILCAPLTVKGEILGVCQVIHSRDSGKRFSGPDLSLFQMFCDSAALALQNARMHQSLMDKQRLEKDMEFAHSVQESFLPAVLPKHRNFKFGAKTIPARDVGGDYYDFIQVDDTTLAVVLGDVSGKGVPAALQMARLMSDFRYISQVYREPADVLQEVNNIMCYRSYRGMFTTVVYLLIDLETKKVKVANGGHHSLLSVSPTGEIREYCSASGAPLGILPHSTYPQEEVTLTSGERVLLYTDGILEPKNKQGEQFGFDRLSQLVARTNEGPEHLLNHLEQSIKDFTENAPQFDDITCVALEVL